MTMLVRNMEGGPTVFADIPNNISVEWQGAGDKAGNDVQFVPDALAENVNFIKALQRGILVVEDSSPEIEAKLAAQVEAFHLNREGQKAKAREVMDRNTEAPIKTVVISETGQVTDGKPEETELPVIIEQRQPVSS